MRRMKSCLLLALALAILMTGCSRAPTPQAKVAVNTNSDITAGDTHTTTTVITYRPRKDGAVLVRNTKEMVVPEGQMFLQAVIVNLLSDATGKDTAPLFGGNASLKSITQSRNVLLVDITSQKKLEEMDERELMNSLTALVNTVTENSTVEYVQIWINGQALSSRGVITNPMKKQGMSLEQLWILHKYYMEKGDVISSDDDNQQVLFYTDSTGNYILANVEQPATRSGNQLDDLIFSMRQAPTSHELASAIPNTLTLAKEPLLTQQDDGSQLVSIWFSSPKYDSLTSQQIYMLSGTLTLAIYCNLPGVDSVRIYIDSRLVTSIPDTNFSSKGDLTAVSFLPKVADMVTLYFPHQQAGKLVSVQRAVSQSDYSHLRARVDELIRGPLAGDEAALTNVFPVGITTKDLLSVQAQGDMAILRFSQSFATNYPTDAAKERLMIYSIVNTLTSINGIRRVQFLVQDSRVGRAGHD